MKKRIRHSIAALLALSAVSAFAGDVVRNGSFNHVLVDWKIPAELGRGVPYDEELGAVTLYSSTMAYDYYGPVLFQPLNVALGGGALEVSVDVRPLWVPPTGQSVAVYLEFLDTSGARQRARVIHPDHGELRDGAWVTFTASYTPGAHLTKLVGISLDREGEGNVYVDNVKILTSAAAGPVPLLTSVSPSAVAYGANLVIQGAHFGAETGHVTLGGRTNGLTVQSWSDTQIIVAVNDPCEDGVLTVEAGGVRSWQSRHVTMASPHYQFAAVPAKALAIPGQRLPIAVFVDFRNGFEPAGGITLSVAGGAEGSFWSPTGPLLRGGGCELILDTTGMTPGRRQVTLTAAGGGLQPRAITVDLDLRALGDVRVLYYQNDDWLPLDGAQFTRQGSVRLQLQMFDTEGREISTEVPRLSPTSSNPDAVDVHNDLAPWGNSSLLVCGSGSAVLTANLPGGGVWTASVKAVIPSHPSFTSAIFDHYPMANTPEATNRFTVTASDPMTQFSWGFQGLWGSILDGDWGWQNYSYSGLFQLGEAIEPGNYLFYASANVNGQPLSISRRLRVVNDPAAGMVCGRIARLGGSGHGHEISGVLEFHDPVSGDLRFERNIWVWTSEYTAACVTPGAYKIRWVPENFGSPRLEPQWYPNAATLADAQTVVVQAGLVATNIHFFLIAPATPSAPPQIAGLPVFNSGAGVMSLTIPTEMGEEYELQKSTTLLDNSWWPVTSAWGDGSVQTLEDPKATGAQGFYRLMRK